MPLPLFRERETGSDIGSRLHVVAVNPALCEGQVRTFQTFASDRRRMADWLVTLSI